MSKSVSVLAAVVGIPIGIALAIGAFLYESFVALLAWRWMVEPTTHVHMTLWAMFGVNMVVSTLSSLPAKPVGLTKEEKSDYEINAVGRKLVAVTIALGLLIALHLLGVGAH